MDHIPKIELHPRGEAWTEQNATGAALETANRKTQADQQALIKAKEARKAEAEAEAAKTKSDAEEASRIKAEEASRVKAEEASFALINATSTLINATSTLAD